MNIAVEEGRKTIATLGQRLYDFDVLEVAGFVEGADAYFAGAEAKIDGVQSGDGVAVQLTVHNSSKKSFDLNGLAVTAFYDQGTPASPGGAGTGRLLTGSLKVGAKATGVYVFTVPKAKAPTVEIQVSSDTSAIIVVYKR